MDSGEEAGAQIMVKVLILAHFKNLFPLFHRHLVFNAFCSLFFISELFSTKLNQGNKIAIQLITDSLMSVSTAERPLKLALKYRWEEHILKSCP